MREVIECEVVPATLLGYKILSLLRGVIATLN